MSDLMEDTPGLLSKRITARDQDKVIIEELWDVSVPGCPMVWVDGHYGLHRRITVMTPEEFQERAERKDEDET